MSTGLIGIGEPVFHPKYGFGVIENVTDQDGLHIGARISAGPMGDYYCIRLQQGGTLFVPVDRAENLGLRPLENGVETVLACLLSDAEPLPENSRERVATLRFRAQAREAGALAAAVRDLLHQRQGRNLSTGEKTWLDTSCDRLITEAALVDHITVSQARAAIREALDRLGRAPTA